MTFDHPPTPPSTHPPTPTPPHNYPSPMLPWQPASLSLSLTLSSTEGLAEERRANALGGECESVCGRGTEWGIQSVSLFSCLSVTPRQLMVS